MNLDKSRLYREYKKEEDKFRAKIKGSDDLSLRSLTYRIIPLRNYFVRSSRGNKEILEKSIETHEFYLAIVDQTMMEKLEDSRTINWWTGFCNRLYVSRTETDLYGTLYASASIAMWGFQDSKSLLMYCKYELENHFEYYTVIFWRDEMRNGMDNQGLDDSTLDDLFQIHDYQKDPPEKRMHADYNAYILSNALRRPIIIFEYSMYKDNSINVYLPLQHHHSSCCKYPLLLAYYRGKYYPLLQMEDTITEGGVVPLNLKCCCCLANIFFLSDKKTSENLMNHFETYMDVVLRYERYIDMIGLELYEPNKYICVRIDSPDHPSYYEAFKRFKEREMGLRDP